MRAAKTRADLSHGDACVAHFEVSGELGAVPSAVGGRCTLMRGRIDARGAFDVGSGPTKEAALRVMLARRRVAAPAAHAHAMATPIVHALWRR